MEAERTPIAAGGLSDTSPEAAAVQIRLLRAMGADGRSRVGNDLSETIVEATRRALRRRHPDASEDEIRIAFIAACYGPGLASEVSDFLVRR